MTKNLKIHSKHLWVHSNKYSYAVRATTPINDGHTIIYPKDHTIHFSNCTPEVREGMWSLSELIIEHLQHLEPHRCQIYFDIDNAKEQSISLHVIPIFDEQITYFDINRNKDANLIHESSISQHNEKDDTESTNIQQSDFLPTLVTGGDRQPFFPVVKKLIQESHRIDLLLAFVQDSGLRLLQPTILSAIKNGSHIRICTGDYLHITQAEALYRILDWQNQAKLAKWKGTLNVHIYENDRHKRSFHPKCWMFYNRTSIVEQESSTILDDVAYIGSSNLSFTALCLGVEWNLLARRSEQGQPFDVLERDFLEIWNISRNLDREWLEDYAIRSKESPYSLPPSEIEVEQKYLPTPTSLQEDALKALSQSRLKGHHKALVIMATGLGKTFLAAFDVYQYMQDRSTQRDVRICFLVHRQEILRQAADCFRRLFPYISFGFYMENREDTDCDFLFASVQKLHRNLHVFSPNHFDYIIIDEVHHAAAKTYRKILSHFQPDFLLGLTATPQRSDHEDIATLFDNHIPFVANLGEGIELNLLTPFHYIGRVDTTDFQPIAMNGRNFEENALNRAICTEDRMSQIFELWNSYPADTTLIFCSSIRHADFVCAWLKSKGIIIASVHSGELSAEREYAIDRLSSGELDALCVVDLFNEGIDIPSIDRIIMLRPTSSPTVFLQQLGRGLRKFPNKEYVTVLDLVGNHRVFLERLDTILSLGPTKTDLYHFLHGNKKASLPMGCQIDIEIAVIDMLQHFLPANPNPSLQLYRQFKSIHGQRPKLKTIAALQIPKINLYGPLQHKDWFSFLSHERDISGTEKILLSQAHPWFSMLEHTPMTKSFKMIALYVLVMGDLLQRDYGLIVGMEWEHFCASCWELISQNPKLYRDIQDIKEEDWVRYWDKWVSSSWEKDGQWLVRKQGRICTKLTLPKTYRAHLAFMSLEIIDARLYQYQQRKPLFQNFEATVALISSRLALRLPAGKVRSSIPTGPITCRLPTGDIWIFKLSKVACHVAHPLGSQNNQIRSLLTKWFGAQASQGYFRLRFSLVGDSWWVEPLGGLPPSFIERTTLPLFQTSNLSSENEEAVCLPYHDKEDKLLFAIRSWETSLSQFHSPIRQNDWLVCRWTMEKEKNKIYIFQQKKTNKSILRKLLQRGDGIFFLQDAQGKQEDFVPDDVKVVAELISVVSPEELLPTVGTNIYQSDVAYCLGISSRPKLGFSIVDGHCFFVEKKMHKNLKKRPNTGKIQRNTQKSKIQYPYSHWMISEEKKKKVWTLVDICWGD